MRVRKRRRLISLSMTLKVYLVFLLKMLFLELMIMALTIYVSFVYDVVYLFFSAFPIAFQQEQGWNQGIGALPFSGTRSGAPWSGDSLHFHADDKLSD